MKKCELSLLSLAVCFALTSCSSNTPTEPSTSSPSSSGTSSSITVPVALAPTPNAQVKNGDQPVTLAVKNAVTTQSAAVTYTYEVASDPAFASKVYSKSGVTEGSVGQTSVTIDRLGAGADYYWRARAEGGGTTGPFSAPRKFTIGPAVVLQAPSPIGPLNGAQVGQRPTLRVTNAQRQGPAGTITYRFEISNTAAFATIIVTGLQNEGVNETGFIVGADLPANSTLFWRAFALDSASGITSPASAAQSFSTSSPSVAAQIAAEEGQELWPGAVPPGTTGRAVLGAHWEIRNLVSYDGIPFVSPPIEALRLFDLLDRGMDPDSAIRWLASNGYPSSGQWYPSVQVIGIPHVYLAFVHGGWELVIRAGA